MFMELGAAMYSVVLVGEQSFADFEKRPKWCRGANPAKAVRNGTSIKASSHKVFARRLKHQPKTEIPIAQSPVARGFLPRRLSYA